MKKDLSFLIFADDNERRTVSHALDLAYRSLDADICTSSFLNVREQRLVKAALLSDGSFSFAFWGGYAEAERRLLICFPEYYSAMAASDNFYGDLTDTDCLENLIGFIEDPISILSIKCSSFTNLSHRDYMGAILNLGIERTAVGDIVVINQHEALVFVVPKMARFIMDNLETIGRTPVKISFADHSKLKSIKLNLQLFDSVSTSLRFDCVISSITGISRDKSKAMINSGLAELNYYPKSTPDEGVDSGDIISVRGYGKFKIINTDTKTMKGKFRLKVAKYI